MKEIIESRMTSKFDAVENGEIKILSIRKGDRFDNVALAVMRH